METEQKGKDANSWSDAGLEYHCGHRVQVITRDILGLLGGAEITDHGNYVSSKSLVLSFLSRST